MLQDKTSRFCGFFFLISSSKSAMPRPSSEDIRWAAIWMKEMLGYQMDEVAASLKMSLSFNPTTLIEIAVYKKLNWWKDRNERGKHVSRPFEPQLN